MYSTIVEWLPLLGLLSGFARSRWMLPGDDIRLLAFIGCVDRSIAAASPSTASFYAVWLQALLQVRL